MTSPIAVVDRAPGATVVKARETEVLAVVMTPMLYSMEPETHDSLWFALEGYCDKHGWGKIRKGRSVTKTLVDKARNQSANVFLRDYAPQIPFLVMVDSDMGLPTGDPRYYREVYKSTLPDRYGQVNFFERMLSHSAEHKIIGGLYKDRLNGVEYQCNRGHNEKGFNDRVDRGELRGVMTDEWVATGAIRIHRDVLTRIRDEAPSRWPELAASKFGRELGWFSRPKHIVGEDVALCNYAAELGIRTYLDLEIRCWHKSEIWR